MSTLEKIFITVKELSKRISVPEYTIRKLIREEELPAYQLTGNRYLLIIRRS